MALYHIKFLIIITVFLGCNYSAFAAPKSLKLDVRIDKNSPMQKQLFELAKELENTAKTYKTTNQLEYWESKGQELFDKLLKSEGYYANNIDVEIPDTGINSIVFYVNTQQRYKISKITIKHTEGSNKNIILPKISALKLKQGQFAIAQDVFAAEEKIIKQVENNNCLLSLSVTHEAIINHLDGEVEINFLLDAGPNATIEKVSFKGLKQVHAEYARKLTGLKEGQCFRNSYIAESRGELQKSGLFSSTTPTIPTTTNEDGSVPVVFNLKERKSRSVKSGLGYSTDLGVAATLGWEHRNLFGNGEKVETKLSGNQKEQVLDLNYTKPFYKRDDQTLKLGIKFENKRLKAYETKGGIMSAFLDRTLSSTWSAGVGARASQAKVKEFGASKAYDYSLLSTPLYVTNDTRNNRLDAKRGYKFDIETAPYFGFNKTKNPFLKTEISGSAYMTFATTLKHVLAVRAATGSILGAGAKTTKIPPNERFYVGGSGSLRGYGYQMAGSIGSNKRPVGGRSFVSSSIELRLKFIKTIGVVGFLDSGFAYTTITPNTREKLLHGVGFGLRYITDFGPIRADIAFPLKRRKFIDSAYQLSFGIGQVF